MERVRRGTAESLVPENANCILWNAPQIITCQKFLQKHIGLMCIIIKLKIRIVEGKFDNIMNNRKLYILN